MRTTSTSEQKPRRRGTSYSLLVNPGAVKAVRALQGHDEAERTHRDQDADRSHCDPWHRRRRPLVGPPDVNVPGVNLGLEFSHWVLRPAWSPPTVGRDPHKRHRLRLRPGAADAVPHAERPRSARHRVCEGGRAYLRDPAHGPQPDALYGPMGPFRFAIEARAGFFESRGIEAGAARLIALEKR